MRLIVLAVSTFIVAKGDASQCFMDSFSFASCCLSARVAAETGCWGGGLTYESCCLSPNSDMKANLLTRVELHALHELAFAPNIETVRRLGSCACLPFPEKVEEMSSWCRILHESLINHENVIVVLLDNLTRASVVEWGSCPLGALALSLFHASSQIVSGAHSDDIWKLPSILYANEVLQVLSTNHAQGGRGPLTLIMETSWVLIFSRLQLMDIILPKLPTFMSSAFFKGITFSNVSLSNPDRPRDPIDPRRLKIGWQVTQLVELSRIGCCSQSDCSCCMAGAEIAFSLVEHSDQSMPLFLRPIDGLSSFYSVYDSERENWLALADRFLVTYLLNTQCVASGRLLAGLQGGSQLINTARYYSLSGQVEIPLRRSIDSISPSSVNFIDRNFAMRVFPFREIISDNVRAMQFPFCKCWPVLHWMVRMAEKHSGPIAMLEGGPHLGDCGLLAASLWKAVDRNRLVDIKFVEPLQDTSGLIWQSIIQNGFLGSLDVVAKALSDVQGKEVDLWYNTGHNGQATVGRKCISSGYNYCESHKATTTTVDAEWPQEKTMHVLKLSVNGAELQTLRGARALLSKRKICTVMMHTRKMQLGIRKGEADSSYGAEVFSILRDAGMKVVDVQVANFEGEMVPQNWTTSEIVAPQQMNDLLAMSDEELPLTRMLVARQRPESAARECAQAVSDQVFTF